nr:carboxypeptidase-like regulatory domain-containing protein [uncultured Allomuricauda sp.]
MKRNKNYFSILGMVLACGVLITSCTDDQTEEDLLRSQQERSDQIAQQEADAEAAQDAANAAALAAAQLLDYTVTLHSNDVPAEGVAVNLTNNAGTTASVSTDSSGNAIFTGLAMGGHTVSISSSDYLDASYNVDFGTPVDGIHYEIIDGKVYSLGNNAESSKVELFSLSGMQTATIMGRVEIETDLTNNTPEVPQDITIRANLDGVIPSNSHSFIDGSGGGFGGQNTTSIYVSGSFTFTEGDIGVATVDNTTGEYTMQVPATDDGTDIELLFPLVEANQTVGFSSVDGQDVGTQIGPQAAVFGPDIVADPTPSIAGVVAEFDPVPEPGRGFDLTFEPLSADLSANLEAFNIDDFPLEENISGTRWRANPGSGYQLTPAVTVSAPELSGDKAETATIEAWMTWTFDSVSYSAQPAGTYGMNEVINMSVAIFDETDLLQDVYALGSFSAEDDGSLIAGSAEVTSNAVIDTGYIVSSFVIVLTGGGDPTTTLVRSGTVDTFRVTDDGGGYTAIPTITVEPSSGGTDATLEIYEMAFKYAFDMDNSGITQGYVALPTRITFQREAAPGNFLDVDTFELITLDEDGFEDDISPEQGDLTAALIVSEGNLVFDDVLFGSLIMDDTKTVDKGRTGFSYSVPTVSIVEPTHTQTTADVNVNADGEITGLSNIVAGNGYNSPYSVTLISGDGTGGNIDLVNFAMDARTGEVTWAGTAADAIVTDGGSGYSGDLNIVEEDFTPSAANQVITIRNGETKVVNVNYGTGDPVAELGPL